MTEGGKGYGHDAPPLGSRLRGNDGLGEGTTEGEGHDGGGRLCGWTAGIHPAPPDCYGSLAMTKGEKGEGE